MLDVASSTFVRPLSLLVRLNDNVLHVAHCNCRAIFYLSILYFHLHSEYNAEYTCLVVNGNVWRNIYWSISLHNELDIFQHKNCLVIIHSITIIRSSLLLHSEYKNMRIICIYIYIYIKYKIRDIYFYYAHGSSQIIDLLRHFSKHFGILNIFNIHCSCSLAVAKSSLTAMFYIFHIGTMQNLNSVRLTAIRNLLRIC